MNENLHVTVRIDISVHEGHTYYYGSDASRMDNSFTLPLTVYNAVNYSDIIKEMVKHTIWKHENQEEKDE